MCWRLPSGEVGLDSFESLESSWSDDKKDWRRTLEQNRNVKDGRGNCKTALEAAGL